MFLFGDYTFSLISWRDSFFEDRIMFSLGTNKQFKGIMGEHISLKNCLLK